MYMTVRDYLLQNATLTAELPGFPEFFTSVQNGINRIQVLQEMKEAKITGITAAKNQLKETLVGQAVDISRKLVAYAAISNNLVLQREVKYSESELKRSVDTILKDQAQVIYARASAHVKELAAFGVSETLLANLLEAIQAFNAAIPKVRLGVTEKHQTVNQLEDSFVLVDVTIKKIDVLMEIVRNTQPVFYNGYKAARKIVDTGVKYSALKGNVKDKITDKPIMGVQFRFELLEGKEILADEPFHPIEKKSARHGNFIIKSMPEGSYAVRISKPGYKEQTVNVNVSEMELCKLKVVLEKA